MSARAGFPVSPKRRPSSSQETAAAALSGKRSRSALSNASPSASFPPRNCARALSSIERLCSSGAFSRSAAEAFPPRFAAALSSASAARSAVAASSSSSAHSARVQSTRTRKSSGKSGCAKNFSARSAASRKSPSARNASMTAHSARIFHPAGTRAASGESVSAAAAAQSPLRISLNAC